MKYYVCHRDQRYYLSTEHAPKNGASRWIHLINPTEEEIHSLSGEYNVPESILSSVADPSEVARSEGRYCSEYDLFILRNPSLIF